MLDRAVVRAGAAAAVVGAALVIVFNALHPRGDDLSARTLASLAGEGGMWAFAHYVIGWGFALVLVGLFAFSRSLSGEPSVSWGRVALVFAVASTAVTFATVAIDGFAMRIASQDAGSEIALAVAYAGQGVSLATIASYFGITPLLYGTAIITGSDYPTWLGWTTSIAGILGLVTATIIFFTDPSTGPVDVLFPVASLLFMLSVAITGILLWRRSAAAATR